LRVKGWLHQAPLFAMPRLVDGEHAPAKQITQNRRPVGAGETMLLNDQHIAHQSRTGDQMQPSTEDPKRGDRPVSVGDLFKIRERLRELAAAEETQHVQPVRAGRNGEPSGHRMLFNIPAYSLIV
jgi:hypothetical protein